MVVLPPLPMMVIHILYMADLLIRARDNTHSDPVKDFRGSYKRGDIVVVKPTGWPWGSEEAKAPKDGGGFVIVRALRNDGVTPVWAVPNGWNPGADLPATPARFDEFIEPERSDFVFETEADGTQILDDEDQPLGVVSSRRNWRLMWNALSALAQVRLQDTGRYDVRWTVLRAFLQRRKDRVFATFINQSEIER